jgi:hypothetical protein
MTNVISGTPVASIQHVKILLPLPGHRIAMLSQTAPSFAESFDRQASRSIAVGICKL